MDIFMTKLFIEYPPLDYYISWSITLKKLNVKLLSKVTYVENIKAQDEI